MKKLYLATTLLCAVSAHAFEESEDAQILRQIGDISTAATDLFQTLFRIPTQMAYDSTTYGKTIENNKEKASATLPKIWDESAWQKEVIAPTKNFLQKQYSKVINPFGGFTKSDAKKTLEDLEQQRIKITDAIVNIKNLIPPQQQYVPGDTKKEGRAETFDPKKSRFDPDVIKLKLPSEFEKISAALRWIQTKREKFTGISNSASHDSLAKGIIPDLKKAKYTERQKRYAAQILSDLIMTIDEQTRELLRHYQQIAEHYGYLDYHQSSQIYEGLAI